MKETVLFVDDEIEILEIYEESFPKYLPGISIITAADGKTAIKKLKKYDVSLVVTNLKMQGINGFELMGYIRDHYPKVPVIVATALSSRDMQQLAREMGAAAYILKPFLIEDLANTILLALKQKRVKSSVDLSTLPHVHIKPF